MSSYEENVDPSAQYGYAEGEDVDMNALEAKEEQHHGQGHGGEQSEEGGADDLFGEDEEEACVAHLRS